MRFSVVVPLFNKVRYIERTLASVVAQSWEDWEVVVVDDGSTDGSAECVAALADPRIRLIRQANAGVAAARNRGIAEAQGEWVAFLDADDWHHPRYLAALDCLIEAYPAASVVATRYRSVVDRDDLELQPWPIDPADETVEVIRDLPARWLQGTTLFTSSVAVRTTLLRSLSSCFPVGESLGEDLDLWFRLAERSPVILSHAPLVARLWVPEGLSTAASSLREPPFLGRMARRAASGRMRPRLARSTRTFVDESRITLARAAVCSGARGQAMALLWRSRAGVARRRWWLTLAMTLCLPSPLVERWQHWRKRRTMLVAEEAVPCRK